MKEHCGILSASAVASHGLMMCLKNNSVAKTATLTFTSEARKTSNAIRISGITGVKFGHVPRYTTSKTVSSHRTSFQLIYTQAYLTIAPVLIAISHSRGLLSRTLTLIPGRLAFNTWSLTINLMAVSPFANPPTQISSCSIWPTSTM